MGGGRLGAVTRAARLEHDDRLGLAHFARLFEKRARIADALDIEPDHLGARIVRDVIEKIDFVDVDLVADIDAFSHRQALARLAHDVKHHRTREDAGLGEERHAASLPARKIHEAAHHCDLGIDHADGVRAGEQQPGCPRDLAQALLVAAALLARFRETGRDDAGGARARRDALLDGVLDVLLRQYDVDEVDPFRHFGQRRIGPPPHDLRGAAIDRIKGALKIALDQVVEQDAAGLAEAPITAIERGATSGFMSRASVIDT